MYLLVISSLNCVGVGTCTITLDSAGVNYSNCYSAGAGCVAVHSYPAVYLQ